MNQYDHLFSKISLLVKDKANAYIGARMLALKLGTGCNWDEDMKFLLPCKPHMLLNAELIFFIPASFKEDSTDDILWLHSLR